jgi:hypothetical protein
MAYNFTDPSQRSAQVWEQRNFANTPEGRQQVFAQEMERQDRANQQARFNQVFGYVSDPNRVGAGGGNSSSGKLGLGDAETRLAALLDDPDSIKETGSYKFRVGQGQEALQRSLGAKGLLNSGNRLTELTKYGQDMGTQEYEAQFRRLSDLLGNYQNSADRRYGTDMGLLGGLANGGVGNTSAMWSAYTNPRVSGMNSQPIPQQTNSGGFNFNSSLGRPIGGSYR